MPRELGEFGLNSRVNVPPSVTLFVHRLIWLFGAVGFQNGLISDISLLKPYCYASAFRRRRHYVFGLYVRPSVRPSVRSLKYPLLTCTWVRWSTRPTVTVWPSVCPSVCPSVRPERFPGICRRTHRGNGLKFYIPMYLDRLQNRLVYGHGLLIFLILALFWLSETGQIWGFRAFPEECMEEMASNFARWCILTTFRTD